MANMFNKLRVYISTKKLYLVYIFFTKNFSFCLDDYINQHSNILFSV